MKSLKRDYIKIILYTIVSILFAMSIYIIVINVRHFNSLSNYVKVSDIDTNYLQYKNNVNLIEEKLNNYSKVRNENYSNLSKALDYMKNDGLFRLIPKSTLSYQDLYNLNDYFMEELINNSWVYLSNLKIGEKYQDTVKMLANNSKYINSVLINNGLILYEDNLDNKIENNYHFIIDNYWMYSNVILSMCNELGDGYE